MILVGGENLIDFIQTGVDGEIPTYKAMPGGSPFNIAMAIGRQELPVGYLTPISSDPLGDLLAARLEGSGVELLSDRRAEPSSLAVVALRDGIAAYQFYRERTAERMVTTDQLANATLASVSAICLGSLALTGGEDADIWADYYCHMHEKGVFTALDPNIRAAFIHDRPAYEARLQRVLDHTDLLKFSDEDLEWLMPGKAPKLAMQELAGRSSATLTVMTRGGEGAIAVSGSNRVEVPSHPVANLVDTVGAGDTFMATLVATLAHRDALKRDILSSLPEGEIESLIRRAAQAAAINCGRSGCNPPRLSELT